MSDFPRRGDISRNLPAELAIRDAIKAVEEMDADTRLTAVVIALDQARNKLADYIDAEIVR